MNSVALNNILVPAGDVDLNSHKLVNVSDPTSLQDAATKNYTDNTFYLNTVALSEIVAPTSSLSLNNQKITNLATPTNDQDASTKLYVDTKISDLVGSAPGLLDTLNEIAAALGDDPNFAATITT